MNVEKTQLYKKKRCSTKLICLVCQPITAMSIFKTLLSMYKGTDILILPSLVELVDLRSRNYRGINIFYRPISFLLILPLSWIVKTRGCVLWLFRALSIPFTFVIPDPIVSGASYNCTRKTRTFTGKYKNMRALTKFYSNDCF